MKSGLVSIILPIYNVQNYLDRCMKSIVNQTYDRLEIIMVDDGSTDNCYELCEKWAKLDNRVRVIHKQNAGLGMARNTGIENANGEYILFVDSDDYIELDTVEKCYDKATAEKADIVIFGHAFVYGDGRIGPQMIPRSEKKTFKDAEVYSIVLQELLMLGKDFSNVSGFWMSAWSSFYSMDLIVRSNWKFVSEREIISEDVYSLLGLYSNVKVVSIIEEKLYNYCDNGSSLTHEYRDDRLQKNDVFYNDTVKLAKEHKYSEEIVNCISFPYIANILALTKQIAFSDFSFSKKNHELAKVLHDATFQNALSKIDLKKESISRRVLFLVMKHKITILVYMLIKANGLERNVK